MGAPRALLGDLGLLVPVDGAVGAGLDHLLVALGLLRVDDHQTVFALVDGAVGAFFMQGASSQCMQGMRQIGHLDDGVLAPLLAVDVHPAMAGPGLSHRVGREVVADELVLVGQEAVVAVVAAGRSR